MGTRTWKNTNENGLAHGPPQNHQSQQPDPPQNGATLGTWAPKPHILHPDAGNVSESRNVDRQITDNEAAGQEFESAQGETVHYVCQAENGMPSDKQEASKSEEAVTEIATKGLKDEEQNLALSALSFNHAEIPRRVGSDTSPIHEAQKMMEEMANQSPNTSKNEEADTDIAKKRLEQKGQAILAFNLAERPRAIGSVEDVLPIDEDWVMVDDIINLADARPLLVRTSSGAGAGEPQSKPFLLHILEYALARPPARRPDTQALRRAAQSPPLPSSKHVGSGETEQCKTLQKVGAYTARNNPADIVEHRNIRRASEDPIAIHPQHCASNSSNLLRVVPDEMATRRMNSFEPRFSSLCSIANIPQDQPKYSDKPNAESRLARARLLFPGE